MPTFSSSETKRIGMRQLERGITPCYNCGRPLTACQTDDECDFVASVNALCDGLKSASNKEDLDGVFFAGMIRLSEESPIEISSYMEEE